MTERRVIFQLSAVYSTLWNLRDLAQILSIEG